MMVLANGRHAAWRATDRSAASNTCRFAFTQWLRQRRDQVAPLQLQRWLFIVQLVRWARHSWVALGVGK